MSYREDKRMEVMAEATDQAIDSLVKNTKAAMSFKSVSKIMNELNTYYVNPLIAFGKALKNGDMDDYAEPDIDQIHEVCKELSALWGDRDELDLMTIIRNMVSEVSFDRLVFEFYIFMKMKEKELESDRADGYSKIFGNVGFKYIDAGEGMPEEND